MDQIHIIRNNQPTVNIGVIGSVSNGKSSITEKITGIKTQKHSDELERNITIKLGYANAKIYKCQECPPPKCYQPYPSGIMKAFCKLCNNEMELMKHVSFIDTPGHNLIMATMLNGTCVMDCTILVESAANKEPASQTKEHLIATKITGLPNSIVCMNKLDLVKKNVALQRIYNLKKFLNGTTAESSPLIPLSANHEINIDILCEYICKYVNEPQRDLDDDVKMIVIRSFNINKQDILLSQIEGGVIGGTLVSGLLKLQDEVSIYPGYISENTDKNLDCKWRYQPINCKILSINSEKNKLEYSIPGGLIGIKLDIDPALTAKDNLVGNILTKRNNNKYLISEILLLKLDLIQREQEIIIKKGDILDINYNACNVKGQVVIIKKNKSELKLIEKPICIQINDYITLSKKINDNIVLLGRAKILDSINSVQN